MYLNIASYFYDFRKKQKRLVYESNNEEDYLEDGTELEIQIFRSPDDIIDRYDLDDIFEKCKSKLDDEEKRVLIELNKGSSPCEVGKTIGLERTKVYYIRNKIKNKIGRLLIS